MRYCEESGAEVKNPENAYCENCGMQLHPLLDDMLSDATPDNEVGFTDDDLVMTDITVQKFPEQTENDWSHFEEQEEIYTEEVNAEIEYISNNQSFIRNGRIRRIFNLFLSNPIAYSSSLVSYVIIGMASVLFVTALVVFIKDGGYSHQIDLLFHSESGFISRGYFGRVWSAFTSVASATYYFECFLTTCMLSVILAFVLLCAACMGRVVKFRTG